MKFVEKYARLCALLGVISVSTWGLGCANDSGSTDAPEKKETPAETEAGSTTGGGTEDAGEEKAEETTEEEKAE